MGLGNPPGGIFQPIFDTQSSKAEKSRLMTEQNNHQVTFKTEENSVKVFFLKKRKKIMTSG